MRLINTNSKNITYLDQNCRYYFLTYNNNDLISREIADTGRFTGNLWDEVKPLIDENKSIIDAGANLGAFAIEFAPLTRKNIYCIEPQRYVFWQLCANLLINKCHQALTYNLALGSSEQDGTYVGIYDSPPHNQGATRLVGSTLPQYYQGNKDIISYDVQLRALDKIIPSDSIIGFIKIDVAGYENNVLMGAKDIITKNKPIILIECFEDPKLGDTFNLLRSYDYNIYMTFKGYCDFIGFHKDDDRQLKYNNPDTIISQAIINRDNHRYSYNLLRQLDKNTLTIDQLFKYYFELIIVSYYVNQTEFNIIVKEFMKYLCQGIFDSQWEQHQSILTNNLNFATLPQYKNTVTLSATNFKEKLEILDIDLEETKVLIECYDYDPKSYWSLSLANPQMILIEGPI